MVSGASVGTTDPNKPLQPKGFLREGQLDCKRKFFEESVVVDEAQPKVSSAPLTGGEKEAFKNQVLNCWAVNIGSRAENGSVIVSMDMQPDGKVVASSMDRGAAMHASIAAGHPVEVAEVPSLADSLGGGIGMENKLSFPLCQEHLDDIVLVTEDQIRDAMQVLFFEDRIVAEGACVVGIAATLAGKLPLPLGPVGTVITGRNVDMQMFHKIMGGEDIVLGDLTLKGKRHGA